MAAKGKGFKSLGSEKVTGGSGKMVGFKGVGTQKPGISGTSASDGGGKFAKGGSGKMAGFTGVKPAKKK